MNLCDIPINLINLQKNKSTYENLFIESILHLFSFPDIKNFFYYTYKDLISEKEINKEHNRWTVLLNWFKHEFNK